MGFAFSNNGLSNRAWFDPATIAPGEVYFTAPPDEAALTAAFSGYTAAAALRASQTAYVALIAGGATVTSTGTSALNGVYALDPSAQSNIAVEAQFISAFAEFTNGSASDLIWALANGNPVTFPTTADFMNFAKVIGQLVAAAKLAAMQGAAMPSAAVTIP